MIPFPLTRPDGTVHAWACGRCGIVGGGGTWRGNGGDELAFNSERPEQSKLLAEQCCVCNCGAPVDRTVIGLGCASCNERDRVARVSRASDAEPVEETVQSDMDIERALGIARRIADPDDGSVEELMESGVDVIDALVREVERLRHLLTEVNDGR